MVNTEDSGAARDMVLKMTNVNILRSMLNKEKIVENKFMIYKEIDSKDNAIL
jgi:hypothetical protein